jgi:prepilin-type N-terminal cleavage/methylation domain-containing protein
MSFISKLYFNNSLIKAFTLLELLVVMTIIVIIMAVGAPVFFTLGRSMALNTEVNNVAANLSLARQWAITHKEKVTFEWNGTNFSYSITGDRTGNIFTTNLLPEVKFIDSGTFKFNAKGECEDIATATEEIKISEQQGSSPRKKKIVIYRLTGGYKVEDI